MYLFCQEHDLLLRLSEENRPITVVGSVARCASGISVGVDPINVPTNSSIYQPTSSKDAAERNSQNGIVSVAANSIQIDPSSAQAASASYVVCNKLQGNSSVL